MAWRLGDGLRASAADVYVKPMWWNLVELTGRASRRLRIVRLGLCVGVGGCDWVTVEKPVRYVLPCRRS